MLDLVLALAILTVLAPVVSGIALAIRGSSRGPALFRQTRIGRFGRTFDLLKFRTMRVDQSDDDIDRNRRMIISELTIGGPAGTTDGIYKLEHDSRVTRIGAWLRRTSLDELPQLWNVVRGEMSLVGPRPSLPWEVDLYEPRFRERERFRPGMTGLWQVSGRNRLTMTQMLELDLEYLHSWSLSRDIGILLRTPAVVLRGDGAR